MEEKEFLDSYLQSEYERPSIATDIVAFTIIKGEKKDYRKLPEKNLSVLLIKRGEHPYRNQWALPGGFVLKGESVEQTARRELEEETGVTEVNLSQLQCFSEPNRDPRGWIISCAFMALAEEEQFHIHSGTDALDAQWFNVSYRLEEIETEDKDGIIVVKKRYLLQFIHKEIQLSAKLELKMNVSSKRNNVEYAIISNDGIAFDHSKIILYALIQLQENNKLSMLAFELLPEYFTLSDLQGVFEAISGEKLLVPNFRRKIAEYVCETDKVLEGHGHRPAKLYKRNYKNIVQHRAYFSG